MLAGTAIVGGLAILAAALVWSALDEEPASGTPEVRITGGPTSTPEPVEPTAAVVPVEGAQCPSRLPGDAAAFDLPSSEPELSIVRALNCANATLVSAIEVGDTGVLAGALSGEALAYWEEESARLQGRYQRAIPTRALVSSVTIDGDTAAVGDR